MSLPRRRIHLIVNADDFNLTQGVSRGILQAHDYGIVTSTSFLINLPVSRSLVRELTKRKRLGVGLHLNVTLGRSLSSPEEIPSLVNSKGYFRRGSELDLRKIRQEDLVTEYEHQIERFKNVFARLPTHLDTHHHLHEEKKIFEVLTPIALRYRLPIRRSRWCDANVKRLFSSHGITLTDYLLKDLDASRAWNRSSLLKVIRVMKAGGYELMCHPGVCDQKLLKISSFHQIRVQELEALVSFEIRSAIKKKRIRLISFDRLNTRS